MADTKSKLANFWYYYKVHTIVGVLVAIALGICIFQSVTKDKYDYTVVLYMSTPVSQSNISMLENELSQYGIDYNNDGKTKVEIIDCSYGENDTVRMNQIGKLQARLTMTDSILFIVDETCFNSLDSQGLFADCGLPEKNGKAYNIGGEHSFLFALDSMPGKCYICKRNIEGTAFDGNAKAVEQNERSTILLENVISSIEKNKSGFNE